MTRTVAAKMGIKENSRAIFVNSDKEALDTMMLPKLDISTELEGKFDYIYLFENHNQNLSNTSQN